ncbi:MAG: acyl-CoA carboxylase subunit beta [Anaerolineales bacterium]|nr:MAG: acyl-CoA carboxylase subunit beta [Anaerolineales bacterium]
MGSSAKAPTPEDAAASEERLVDVQGHQALISELKLERERIRQGGGAKRIETQHAKGKLTSRERINRLLDDGSFQEIDAYMTHRHTDFGMDEQRYPGDSVVVGFGKVNGRLVCVHAQDFTVLGGSFSEVQGQKVAKAMDLALESGVPVIGLNDSVGARIQEGVYSLAAYSELFWRNTQASGVIPQISVMLGPCAGGSVYSPGLTDFVIMTKGTSHMFITGPQVIKTVTGEEVDLETLGGATTHSTVSGVAHFTADDEGQALELTRTLLSYLPSNNAEPPPAVEPMDDPWRMDVELNTVVPVDPGQAYNMKTVIRRVFDQDSFFEVHRDFAQNALVGFSRLHGQVVGIVAQQPMILAGVIDIDAADKIARFIRFCDAFNIPIVTFVDSPGFMPGVAQEHGGIIRHGAKIVYAYSEATVPKLCVVTRKAYGGAYIVMSSKYIRTDLIFAWPTAELAVMGAEGAVNILYRRQLKAMEDPDSERARLEADFREKFSKPYAAAASGHIDDILIPAETRPRLIAALELLRDKQVKLPPKKHGNMPL